MTIIGWGDQPLHIVLSERIVTIAVDGEHRS
jgi:hypothetical protein